MYIVMVYSLHRFYKESMYYIGDSTGQIGVDLLGLRVLQWMAVAEQFSFHRTLAVLMD